MSLLIQINSADQITFSSSSSLSSSAVTETNPGILKHLVAQQYFSLIRCVLSNYNLFHSVLVLQQLGVLLCALLWSVLGLLAGRLEKAQGHKQQEPSISGSY